MSAFATLIGVIVREPQIETTRINGRTEKVARFVLRCRQNWGNAKPNFFDIVAYGRQADFVERNGQRDRIFSVHADVQRARWQAANGEYVTSTEFVANNIEAMNSQRLDVYQHDAAPLEALATIAPGNLRDYEPYPTVPAGVAEEKSLAAELEEQATLRGEHQEQTISRGTLGEDVPAAA